MTPLGLSSKLRGNYPLITQSTMSDQRPIFRRTTRPESATPGELFSEYWEESRGGWLFLLLAILAIALATW